jgi:hypothetical protein
MASEDVTVRLVGRDADDHVRDAVLRLGRLLGWESSDVMAFTEGLTGCPWERCGSIEFGVVLDEYQMLARAIETKRSQRVAREREHGSAVVQGATDATPG